VKTTLAFLFALSLTGANALAEEQQAATPNTSSVKASDVQKPDEQRKDQSEEITNARMRAEAGSKSKWSVKANLSYSGGSVEKPLDKLRPNYRSGVAQETRTSLGGTLAIAYRATDKATLRAGTGISVLTPFHNKDKELGQNHYENSGTRIMNVSTPYLELSSAFRKDNLMLMPSATIAYFSEQRTREDMKKDFEVSADLTMVSELEGSNWQPGITASGYYDFHQDGKQDFDVIGNDDARDDYGIGLYPFIEYAFNDRYSFRTLLGFSFTHVRSENADTFIKDKVYQSMGVGIALTKEVYLYPNVQFLPDDIRGDLTNVGVSTTFSVF
jgi:hypothetical protein